MTITGGTISYEDGIKATEDYAPARKVRVELRFDVAEGADADAVVAAVAEKAKAQVYELLGSTAPAVTRSRVRPPKAKEEPAAPAAKSDKDRLAEAAGVQQPKTADPAAIEEDFTVQPEADAASMDDPTVVEPEPVSDAELNKAVQLKNGEIKDPVAIRGIIASFNPDPSKQFTLAQIPQAQRRTFLAKLAELKPKGT